MTETFPLDDIDTLVREKVAEFDTAAEAITDKRAELLTAIKAEVVNDLLNEDNVGALIGGLYAAVYVLLGVVESINKEVSK